MNTRAGPRAAPGGEAGRVAWLAARPLILKPSWSSTPSPLRRCFHASHWSIDSRANSRLSTVCTGTYSTATTAALTAERQPNLSMIARIGENALLTEKRHHFAHYRYLYLSTEISADQCRNIALRRLWVTRVITHWRIIFSQGR